MAQVTDFPKSIHSDVDPAAIGEVLARFYNVGITNPWFEAGLSDQETYNRRRLPWSGFDYSVDTDTGNVSGPNIENVPESLQERWVRLAEESQENGAGEFYADLQELKEERLDVIGAELSADVDTITVETVGGMEVERLPSEITEAQEAQV